MKKNFDNAISLFEISEEELNKINSYSLTQLRAEDIFAFGIVLCDNEIDRDFERFDLPSLKTLSELFLGKTGILNHEMKAENQIARIYSTKVEVTEEKTSYGENYARLKAYAYMLRNEKNSPLIDEICAGIKKEVSINCAVSDAVCSVCGKSVKKSHCEHTKGKNCCHILKNPTDAYEWSFVAVPAQRNAGTVKSFDKRESLEEIAEKYKSFLKKEIIRLSAAVTPEISVKSIDNICCALDVDGLEKLRSDFLKSEKISLKPQLTTQSKALNESFKI